MTGRHWLVIAAIAIVAAVVGLWPKTQSVEAPAQAPARDAGVGPRSRPAPTLTPKPPSSMWSGRTPAPPFDASVQHTADPCTMPGEGVVPTGFESVTAQGITVGWFPGDAQSPGPTHVRVPAMAIAHLVGGLLEEAGQLTGTVRRSELTVIIHRSAEEFRSSTRAPSWAGGLYDGGAVQLFANPSEELGISLPALRHEVMHAQLHAAIGCMPFWLNEGLAEYISGPPPLRAWIELLRSPGSFGLDLLRNPAVLDSAADARKSYSVSLAMVFYISEHGGEPALQHALRSVYGADTPRAIELWNTLYPRIDYEVVLESLAQSIFGMPISQLGPILDGPLCCHGLGDVTELTCRVATTRPTTRTWFETWSDLATAPRAMCKTRW